MQIGSTSRRLLQLLGLSSLLLAATALSPAFAGDRLLATGGATSIEGAAGGGIVPWAVMSGYATREQWGGDVFATHVDTRDYRFDSFGASFSYANRVELSVARQRLDIGRLSRQLSLPDSSLHQDVFGLKVRLFGDLVYDRLPQVSAGLQHKRQRNFTIPQTVGARRSSDEDAYISASRLVLGGAFGYNLLLNGTLRYSRANQTGLLGFGGDRNDQHDWLGEASVAVMPSPHWVVGVEYRQKPDNLSFARESDWKDIFVGYFPNKHLAVVAAWADLGSIATLDDQTGMYLSLQLSY
ncbi:DUF3034 family protein [Halopseudomonas salegens]|uniref:DUF3034 family protein n=1 Tax=Halopseudomonas salegens TaxID=1434072 RepID=A0A1H2FYW3_9GAMM|nr:DUF3034 family protein [Halopseudomonas salegens]SDU12512.1 Protein of unknown function [Halopseudomonas salegens]